MSDNMHDLSGWQKTSCAVSDRIRNSDQIKPLSSLTDLDGQFGTPIVYTEWGGRLSEIPALRDYRWPDSERPCEHWVPAGDPA